MLQERGGREGVWGREPRLHSLDYKLNSPERVHGPGPAWPGPGELFLSGPGLREALGQRETGTERQLQASPHTVLTGPPSPSVTAL